MTAVQCGAVNTMYYAVLQLLAWTPLVHTQLATSRSAAEIWEFIDAETERRKQQAESAAVEQKGAKALPPSKRSWAARPWQCLVSPSMLCHLHRFVIKYYCEPIASLQTAKYCAPCGLSVTP